MNRTGAIGKRGGAIAAILILMLEASLAEPVSAAPQVDEVQAGMLLLATPAGERAAPRINTHVDLAVSGLVARTTIRQSFRNDSNDRVEAIYVFPLPDGAAVDRLRMRIGERYIEGEIREKEEANRTYEAARAEGKRSGLVEQQRANLFTTRLANLPSGETIVIEIEYLEAVRFEDGTFSIRVPLTLTPRYIPGEPLPGRRGSGWSADTDRVPDASLVTPPVTIRSEDHRVTLNADIEAGVPLSRVASRYHPIRVTELDAARGRYGVTLRPDRVPMDHDLELTWRPVAESAPRATLFFESLDGKPHYLLMVLPPDAAPPVSAVVPRDLVFVVDTSGSMHGTSIMQAKRVLQLALDGLRPVDRFNIVQFNSATSALFSDSVEALPANVVRAERYVDALRANGGTEMRPALQAVLHSPWSETHLRQIVFITDGSVGNESELVALIDAQLGSARLFTVGIGSAPNGWFMRKAAEAGRGTFTNVSALHEVAERVGDLVRKLERPQVTDIRIDWPAGNDVVAYPEQVPDLYAGEPVAVRARLETLPRAGDELRISGDSGSGRFSVGLPLSHAREHRGVAALWARSRIEALGDRERSGGDPEAIRRDIVATALAHDLVSAHTSLVAVDKTPVPDAGSPLATGRVPNLLPYGQSASAIFGLPATATPQALHFAAAIVALAVAAVLRLAVCRRRGRYAPGGA